MFTNSFTNNFTFTPFYEHLCCEHLLRDTSRAARRTAFRTMREARGARAPIGTRRVFVVLLVMVLVKSVRKSIRIFHARAPPRN